MRNLVVALCAGLCVSSSLVEGQTTASVDAGGARVRYGDTVQITAGTVSATASTLTHNSSLSGLIAASSTQQSSWTMFATASGSVFSPARRSLRGEVHANGSLTTYGAPSGSGQLLGGARVHVARSTAGAWLGASGGGVKDPIGWRSMTAAEIGGWLQAGRVVAQVVAMPVRIAGGLNYTDTEGTIRFGASRAELTAVGGFRSNIRGYDDYPSAWASVNAVAWVLRSVGLTAAAGNYPADIGQDLPSASYLSLGVRVAPRRIIDPALPLPHERLPAARAAIVPELSVSKAGSGDETITFRASAARVEVMGDFTDWAPVQMSRGQAAGAWVTTLPISSGVHQVNVRIDGGEWRVPAGLTVVRDEFGGSVGVLLVP